MAKEGLNKTDVDKRIKVSYSSAEFEKKVKKIIDNYIKNDKALEDRVVNIHKNVMTQFQKALWTKRGFWRSMLKNQAS
jgi:hypothetical protein